jgi:CRP-like cAMP-binding protein
MIELFGPFEKKFNLFFGQLERLFINEVIINLFARTYLPDEEILQPGDSVDGVMFILEGHLAVCEPSGDPFCIFGEGSFLGDFQVVKNIPWFFLLKSIHPNQFETQMERDEGDIKLVAT